MNETLTNALEGCLYVLSASLKKRDLTGYLDGISFSSTLGILDGDVEMGRCELCGIGSENFADSISPIQHRRNQYVADHVNGQDIDIDHAILRLRFVVSVRRDLLADEWQLKAVIMHELIHACSFPYGGHGGTFRMLADIVSEETDIDVMATVPWYGKVSMTHPLNALLDVIGDVEVTLRDGRAAYVDGIGDDGLAYLTVATPEGGKVLTMEPSGLLEAIGIRDDGEYEAWLAKNSHSIGDGPVM